MRGNLLSLILRRSTVAVMLIIVLGINAYLLFNRSPVNKTTAPIYRNTTIEHPVGVDSLEESEDLTLDILPPFLSSESELVVDTKKKEDENHFSIEEMEERYKHIRFQKRSSPIKIIDAFPFNKEVDLLELRLETLKDVVDHHILVESAWTQNGSSKPFYFNEVKHKKYSKWLHKITHIMIEEKPKVVKTWENEEFVRKCIGTMGLPALTAIKQYSQDDMLLVFDFDEIPSANAVQFLREYTGYPQRTTFCLRWTYYGFFYLNPNPTCIGSGVSLGFLNDVLQNNTEAVRKSPQLKRHDWVLDSPDGRAGWHCSWCFFNAESYVNKLTSALEGDGARWGDFSEKLNLDYIRENRKLGRWFDGSSNGKYLSVDDSYLAPEFALQHFRDYEVLLNREKELP